MRVIRKSIVLVVSLLTLNMDASQVSSFLKSVSTQDQKKSLAQKKQTTSSNLESQFLQSLSGIKKKRAAEQQQQVQESQKQQEQQAQELATITNLYGNPKYKEAMKILNDHELQASYEQDLNDIHLFFFNYSQQVVGQHHRAAADTTSSSQTVSSFLSSLSDEAQAQQEADTDKSKDVTSFLANVKG